MPDKPVPIVKALDAVAVTVIDPPKLTEEPLIVMALFVSEELPMLLNVLVEPEIDVPAKVVIVPPKDTEVEPIVIALLANPALGIVVLAVMTPVPLPYTYPVSVPAPVPPLEAFKMPPKTTAPEVPVEGVKPVAPALKDVTPPAKENCLQDPAA